MARWINSNRRVIATPSESPLTMVSSDQSFTSLDQLSHVNTPDLLWFVDDGGGGSDGFEPPPATTTSF